MWRMHLFPRTPNMRGKLVYLKNSFCISVSYRMVFFGSLFQAALPFPSIATLFLSSFLRFTI